MMMKSLIVAVALATLAVLVSAQDEQTKVCFQGNDQCSDLKEAAKNYFKTIRDQDNNELSPVRAALAARPGTPGSHLHFLRFLDGFEKLFNMTSKYDCKVEICKCNDAGNALECTLVVDKVKDAASKAQAPECVQRSEKAKAFFGNFKKDVADRDREAIQANIAELREHLRSEIKARDTSGLDCLKETVQTIRKDLKEKLKKFDIQENCDFCKVAAT